MKHPSCAGKLGSAAAVTGFVDRVLSPRIFAPTSYDKVATGAYLGVVLS